MRFITGRRNVIKAKGITPKVIAAGFPRCATSSLQAAFENELGLRPCMHAAEILPYTDRIKASIRCLNEENKTKLQGLLHDLFDGYAAICDAPGSYFVEDLMEMYPDAKIVLNIRESPEVWQRSIKRTLAYFGTFQFHAITYWIPQDYWHYMFHQNERQFSLRKFGTPDIYSTHVYKAHIQNVKAKAADLGRDVLVFQPSMGWEPLCKFLNMPIPKGQFPHVNDEATIRTLTWILLLRGILAWVGVVAVPIFAVLLAMELDKATMS